MMKKRKIIGRMKTAIMKTRTVIKRQECNWGQLQFLVPTRCPGPIVFGPGTCSIQKTKENIEYISPAPIPTKSGNEHLQPITER